MTNRTNNRTRAVSRRTLLATAVAGAAAAGIRPELRAAAAPARQDAAKTLTVALNGSPFNLDPHSSYDYRSTVAIRGPFEGLIALKGGATDEYVGVIAESWSANADKSVWTFKIRPNVTFQDGTPCDAEAVRASFERFLTLGMGPVNVIGRFVSDPKQITAPDAATVVFDLGKPQPVFEAAMSSQYGPLIVNAKKARETETDGDWSATAAQTDSTGLGTGPYKIDVFETGSDVQMSRYENYWGGWKGDEFENIVLRTVEEVGTRRQLIEQGQADIVDNLTPEALQALEQNADLVLDKSYSTQVMYYTLLQGRETAKPEARQAIIAAFPYDDVVQGVYKGYAKRGIGAVAELTRGFAKDTPVVTTDLDAAKQLLAKAGLAEGTTLTLMQEAGDENVKAATQLLQANLAKIGITLDIQTVDTAAQQAMFYGDAPAEERPHLMTGFWWPDYNDAYNHLYPQVACDSWGSKGANGGFYCNKEVDAGLAAASAAADDATYMSSLAKVQQILAKDDPSGVYFLQPQWTTVLRKGIENFAFNPIYIGTYDFYRLRRSA